MPNYCVNSNAQANGDHEVHDLDANKWCLPALANRVPLGYHSTCSGAVSAAKAAGYTPANGCKWCAEACHTG